MLHTLRKLAREIHRRSVWQVLAAYLVLWFVVYQSVDFLTDAVGLPLWTPAMAFVLMGIGLPIVLATAVVQGGLPGLRIVDVVDPNELEGLSPEEVHVIPEAHPLHGIGFLTWRNAVLGGVMAAALLVTSVVAYLMMWAFGIGPVGSLTAQGILEAGDVVLVAAFDNRTDQPDLGLRIRDLMRAELARSTLVEVADGDTLDVLDDLPSEGPDGIGDLGERARIAGAQVVVDGTVGSAVAGYLIYARVRLPDGTVLASFDRHAGSQAEIPAEVGRLALRLRERFGESLREIHEDMGAEELEAEPAPN